MHVRFQLHYFDFFERIFKKYKKLWRQKTFFKYFTQFLFLSFQLRVNWCGRFQFSPPAANRASLERYLGANWPIDKNRWLPNDPKLVKVEIVLARMFSGNKTLDQLKKTFLPEFCHYLLAFSSFSRFFALKMLINIVRPAFGVCSTQMLVEIYHNM